MTFVRSKFHVFSKVSICLGGLLVLTVSGLAANPQQDAQGSKSLQTSTGGIQIEGIPAFKNIESAPEPVHRFWDRQNVLLFSGVAVFRALDYTSTKNMLARGREEKLIPDDVVYNDAGFASLEAAGAATSIGISYLLHRTGHHKLERWMSIGHISVTGYGAARNYALESSHR